MTFFIIINVDPNLAQKIPDTTVNYHFSRYLGNEVGCSLFWKPITECEVEDKHIFERR